MGMSNCFTLSNTSVIKCLTFLSSQLLSDLIMSGKEAEGRLQVFQIYRLLQWAREGNKVQIEKMINLGVENLINLTEPKDGTAVLHVAVSANNQGDGPFLLFIIL